MTKNDLLLPIAAKAAISPSMAEKVLAAFIEALGEDLAEGNATILRNFGSFKTVVTPARSCRNLHTGEIFFAPATRTVQFTAAAKLKESISDGMARSPNRASCSNGIKVPR